MRRDRSHAHGTAARRAPMWAAGPPGCVGNRSAQRPQGAQGKGGLEGEGLPSVAQRPSRIGEPGTGIPVFALAKMPPLSPCRAVRAGYNFCVNPE